MDKRILENNQKAWDQAFEYHKKARNNVLQRSFADPTFTTFDESDKETGLIDRINELQLEGKKVCHMQTNNGRELLSLMRKTNAFEGVGFDLSNEAITEARELAKIAKLNAKFECVNIFDISENYNNYFDAIFISEGSLSWLSNMHEYFKVMNRLLKTGGKILLAEIHPIAFLLEDVYDTQIDYEKPGPYKLLTSLDYVGEVKYEPDECYCYMHKLSDIIMAIINNNFEIKYLNESKKDTGWMDPENNNKKFPLSFQLLCYKK